MSDIVTERPKSATPAPATASTAAPQARVASTTAGATPEVGVASATTAAAPPATAPAGPTAAAAAQPTPANANKRRRLLWLIALVVVVLGIGYGVWYVLVGAHFESTDDAYVAGNVVQVTPQVSGTVVAIKADDTDIVQQGQELVVLDPSDARVALDQAEAQLAQTVREVRGVYANNGTLRANVATRQADTIRARSELVRAQDDYQRRAALVASGAVSKEELQHMQAGLDAAKSQLAASDASVAAAKEQLASNETLTDGTSVAQHPNVQRAAARVREAYLALERDTLPAPVSGQVAKRGVQLGQRVAPGTPLMAIVPLDALWIDANFKEVQLRKMRVGQPVKLEADLYGGKVEYDGKIVGLSRRDRQRVLAAARAERDRQLDQGRAARAGAHRARPQAARRPSAADRPVGRREGRHVGPERPAARERASGRHRLSDAGIRARHACRRRADRSDHRGQSRGVEDRGERARRGEAAGGRARGLTSVLA